MAKAKKWLSIIWKGIMCEIGPKNKIRPEKRARQKKNKRRGQ